MTTPSEMASGGDLLGVGISPGHLRQAAAGRDRMKVGIGHGAMREHGDCKTSFTVHKFAAEQTDWARRRIAALDLDLSPQVPLRTPLLKRLGVQPFETLHVDDCNVITVAGWQMLISATTLTTGGTITAQFSATAGRIGVGSANTTSGLVTWQPTVASSDTNLTAGAQTANQYWQLCGAAPTLSTAATPFTVVFTASFAGANGNFGWSEFAIDKGTTSGTAVSGSIINHGVTPGTSGTASTWTKQSGQTWNATATLSFGYIAGTPT